MAILFLYRETFRPSHKNRLFFISFFYSNISINKSTIYIRSWFHVPNISISRHPIFLFRQCDRERMRERKRLSFQVYYYLLLYFIHLGTGEKKGGRFPFFLTDKGKIGNVFFVFGLTCKKIDSGSLDSFEVQRNLTNEDKNKSHIYIYYIYS